MEKLIIKNLGAIIDIDIQLSQLTIFIGKQGTGKSTLAKVISIFRNESFWNDLFQQDDSTETFLVYTEKYGIRTYFNHNTEIQYSYNKNRDFVFNYQQQKVSVDFSDDIKRIFSKFINAQEFDLYKAISSILPAYETTYIPVERSLVTFLKDIVLTNAMKEVTLPSTILSFSAAYNDARKKVRKLEVDFLGVTYSSEEEEDYLLLRNDSSTKLPLALSASGMQFSVPTLVIFEAHKQKSTQRSYAFEEPEISLFPAAQEQLVQWVVSNVLSQNHNMLITTHSPYLITAINNLLMAGSIVEKHPESREEVADILGSSHFLTPDKVTAYYINNPEEYEDQQINIEALINETTGLIAAKTIDSVSEEIHDTFSELNRLLLHLKKQKIQQV